MIITAQKDGRFIKALTGAEEGSFGLHSIFGFISEQGAMDRFKSRRRRGIFYDSPRWKFLFSIFKDKDGGLQMKSLDNCRIKSLNMDQWRLESPFGNFLFSHAGAVNVPSLEIIEKEPDLSGSRIALVTILFILAFMLISLFIPKKEEEIVEREEPIAVEVARQPAVPIKMAPRAKPTKEQIKRWKIHRAVQQNLGLLGLVGKADLSKAVGGLPTKLKNTTAGAGQGGDAGSGGELLVGLGKGVKKTTVGNTGVKGLGGIGTKGRGGGRGGYGNTSIASGEGAGLSTIAISQDAVVDGGLDKYILAATIQKYLNQVRACYENELQKNSGLAGIVHIDFEVNGKGRLNYSRLKKSTLGNSKVENCITTKMMTWKFPLPKGGVNVPASYPFVLRPSGA